MGPGIRNGPPLPKYDLAVNGKLHDHRRLQRIEVWPWDVYNSMATKR